MPRKFVRVRSKSTGHHYSVREDAVNTDVHVPLKQPGERNGRPLPPKFKSTAPTTGGQSQTTTTEGRESASSTTRE